MFVRTTPLSPFGRKVRMAAIHLGIPLEMAPTDFTDADDPLRIENPLGKMPVLATDDGRHLYDSRVIVEYLDLLAGGLLVPGDQRERIDARLLEALCDGILDAGVTIVMEGRMRAAEEQSPRWIAHQQGKIDRGLAALSGMIAGIDPSRVDIGSIALACMLDWLAFRQLATWREDFPELRAWLERFDAAHPAFAATRPTAA